MKYILLPIHPEWCCKFMNGDKETEVRRRTVLYNAINNLIKEQGKAPCLMYCTEGGGCITSGYTPSGKTYIYFPKGHSLLSGKVIAEFEASAEEISIQLYGDEEYDDYKDLCYETPTAEESELLRKSCLTYYQIRDYLGEYPKREPIGTAIHVKPGTMKTDGFPKNLSDYGVRKAPQSFMYVEVGE